MQQLKQLVKRLFGRTLYRGMTSAAAKARMLQWSEGLKGKTVAYLPDASYNVFTYHGEDGIIHYLLQQMKGVPSIFVDIGSGDCIKSNCANLVTHFGWEGLFVDGDAAQLAIGKNFYEPMVKNGVSIKMILSTVTPSNINELLAQQSIRSEIGLLSIDIDGNDYWVWKAIEAIQPRLVVIEAKVEFGSRNIVVPYGKANHHSADKLYNGASVEALRILGEQKGYKLAGANRQGYNLFFVRKDEAIRVATTDDILRFAKDSFYPESFFSSHTFVPA